MCVYETNYLELLLHITAMSLERILAASGNLFLVLQIWVINCVRAQLEPPKISVSSRTENTIRFMCTTFTSFPIDEWVLYRNSVLENTTDPCISAGNFSNVPLTITSECDGLYSCGVEYTDSQGSTGFVLSEPLAIYGKFMCKCSNCMQINALLLGSTHI